MTQREGETFLTTPGMAHGVRPESNTICLAWNFLDDYWAPHEGSFLNSYCKCHHGVGLPFYPRDIELLQERVKSEAQDFEMRLRYTNDNVPPVVPRNKKYRQITRLYESKSNDNGKKFITSVYLLIH